MAKNIHVVPHFHWDREWYFTSEESKILLVQDMEEVLELLEQNPDYPCFVLDGQTAILEDYIAVKPENRGRVQQLVKQGKLMIGPWYTQTDEMVVGGESIVRNLLYGKLDCEEFGDRMMIGYLPDSFGQSARLPQILNGFGINRCMLWRGISERMGTDKTEFRWEDEEGSQVTVQLLPLGYAIGKYLPEEETALKQRLDKYLPVLDRGATTDYILLPNGHDQMPVQKNIFSIMEKIEKLYPGRKTTLGRYEEVFDKIKKAPELAVLKGEFLDGKYMRVHRSIYSSRADLKSSNTRIENKITNILEPLMSIAYSLGFEYQHGLVEAIWKELLKNHAHDSIGCCCSDKVHRAIENRFFLAEDRTDQLIHYYQRSIVDAMSCEAALDKLTAFNLLPYERTSVITGEIVTKMKAFQLVDEEGSGTSFEILSSEIMDAGLIDRQIVHYGDYDPFVRYVISFSAVLPAMGYKTYLVRETGETGVEAAEDGGREAEKVSGREAGEAGGREADGEAAEAGGREAANGAEASGREAVGAAAEAYGTQTEEFGLENQYYQIRVLKNGSLEIQDKENGLVYHEALLLEDGSDDGDEYDYSPLEHDLVLTSHEASAKIEVRKFQHFSTAVIAVEMRAPKDLESRKRKIIDGVFRVEFTVTLKAGSPVIEVEAVVDNQVRDHRVRVLVPNGLAAQYSVSDNQFGSIRRPVVDSAMEIWEREHWSERPDSIYPYLSYVHGGTESGMAVLTNSVREYEITGELYDTIAVTLFRSVGVLGKEELYRRPGRPSGIKMETPDSQLMGLQRYQLALTTHISESPRLAKEYLTPIVTYNKMPHNAMKLNPSGIVTPYRYSLLRLTDSRMVMSVLKKAEKDQGLLLRCYNPGTAETESELISDYHIDDERNLDETKKGGWDGNALQSGSNQVRTFRLVR